MIDQHWQNCLLQLQQELPAQQFSAWIKDLNLVNFDQEAHTLKISAMNRFKLDWVKTQYLARIEELLTKETGLTIALELIVENKKNKTPAVTAIKNNQDQPHSPTEVFVNVDTPILIKNEETQPHFERARLNAELTFETFVTGKANQLARAAALQVADNPGTSYNPLFLYGGVGLGKTHLVHAIGNALIRRSHEAKVRYIHAEQYVSDVVRAYQRKNFDDFKRYYHSLDLLLIDDIQFFAGKSRTQEEFFYAFEALVNAKKQIIITSDTYPKELAEIDDRLRSRFDSGLTVAIEPPELEMRVAILLKKAEQENTNLSEDVAFFIAKHLRQNVRELEGALRKVLAYAKFSGKTISVELAKEALKDLLSVQRGQISVENIQKTTADFYKIKVSDMYSKKRPNNIALPRQIAMYLAKELTQKSLPEIGELFGGRDHTTVLHAVRKIAELRQHDSEINHQLHVLEQTLKN